jgi:hypothetical protein
MTHIIRQSARHLWKEVQRNLSWKTLWWAIWHHKGFVMLCVGVIVVSGRNETLTFDPTATTLTAPQLGALVRVAAKPPILTAGFVLTLCLVAIQMMSMGTPEACWDQTRRALCMGMIVTLAFWGGVYATTYAYTAVMTDTSTIVLHHAVEHSIP